MSLTIIRIVIESSKNIFNISKSKWYKPLTNKLSKTALNSTSLYKYFIFFLSRQIRDTDYLEHAEAAPVYNFTTNLPLFSSKDGGPYATYIM